MWWEFDVRVFKRLYKSLLCTLEITFLWCIYVCWKFGNIKHQMDSSGVFRVERWDSPVSWDHEGFDVHVDQVQNEEEPQTLSLSSEEKCEGEVIWSVSLLFFAMLIHDSHAWTSLEVLIYLSLKQDGWFFVSSLAQSAIKLLQKGIHIPEMTCLKKHTHTGVSHFWK